MKLKNFLLTVLILCPFFSIAQEPSRFPIKENSVWRINYEYCCGFEDWESGKHAQGDEEFIYFIDGDTVIGSRTYFRFFKTGILFLNEPLKIENKYMGAIRDSSNTYFFVYTDQTQETLLYDFDAEIGQVMNQDGFPVDEIDTLENGRRIYYFYIITVHCGSMNTIIEGIGWLGGILEGNSCSFHPGVRGYYLVCYKEGDELIYKTEYTRGEAEIDCNMQFNSIPDKRYKEAASVIILPGRQLQLSLPENSEEAVIIQLFSLTGSRVFYKTGTSTSLFDVNSLDKGIYFATIQSGMNQYAVKIILD